MKIDIIEMTDRKAVLDIQDVRPYFVNALRRTLIADVPKLAIEYVTFYDNTSGLFDEIIAHRLGLVPVPTDLEAFVPRDQCTCEGEGCPSCTVRFTLSKEGPCTVTSGDLQSDDPEFRAADPDIPIVELLPNQRLILETEAILGSGSQHAKWQPVSGCGYKYYPIVELDQNKFDAVTKKAVINACSTGVMKDAAGKIVIEDVTKINLNDDFEKAYAEAAGLDWPVEDEKKLGIRVRGDDRRFIFRFETDGSLTPYQAVRKATVMLQERFDVLSKLTTTKVR
ncbi:MAG: DNA-directed RNA polymerase subunit D [Euryarchaeota archaeon]|nr:DNA-directed RNA polymerase subunit D [Euryarchaeota archaeon]